MLDGKFIQGTTPTHQFALPFSDSLISDLSITYSENGEVIVKRTLEDCEINNDIVSITLTQQESLSFTPNSIVEVQLKLATNTGSVLASPKYRIGVESALDTEIMTIEEPS